MLKIFDGLRGVTTWAVFVKMFLAFLCGSAIGMERSYKNRPAGFRTHILVCVAACTAALTGLYIYLAMRISADISRIAAQIVSGLGFIGAGTIIVTKNKTVKGLTTAAGLWISGVIGLAIGFGFFEGGIIATALVLVTEIYFAGASHGAKRIPDFMISLQYREKPALDDTLRFCKNSKMSIINLQVKSPGEDDADSVYFAVITLRPRQKINKNVLFEHIRGIKGVLDLEQI